MLWLIIILALLVRLPLITGSFWLDEAAQALESSRPLLEQLNLTPDFQPPLLHLITYLALKVSSQEWWLRLIGAVIPGLITIFLTQQMAQVWIETKNKFVKALPAIFIATSSLHIFYSQELRPYSLPAMWACLGWWSLTKFFQQRQLKSLIIFSISLILGLYSSYLYPFLGLAQLVYSFIQLKKLQKPQITKKIIVSFLLGFLAFLPWLPQFRAQLQAGQALRQSLPGWEQVVSLPQFKALPLVLAKFIFGVLNLKLNPTFLGLSLFLALLTTWLGLNYLKTQPKKLNQPLIASLTWFLIPLVTAWLISFWVPVVRPKRLLLILPGFYLLLTQLIAFSLKKKQPLLKISSKILVLLILGINLISTYQYYTRPQYQRENWRSLYQEIQARFPQKETLLVFSFYEPFAPIRWYNQKSQQPFQTFALQINQLESKEALSQELKPIFDYDFVLIFDYLRDLTDPQNLLEPAIENYGYQGIGVIDYPNLGFVRIYVKDTAKISS